MRDCARKGGSVETNLVKPGLFSRTLTARQAARPATHRRAIRVSGNHGFKLQVASFVLFMSFLGVPARGRKLYCHSPSLPRYHKEGPEQGVILPA